MGVDRHDKSRRANAISSKMVRGVAGLSSMMRRWRRLGPRDLFSQAGQKTSEFQTCRRVALSMKREAGLTQHVVGLGGLLRPDWVDGIIDSGRGAGWKRRIVG